MLMNSIEMQNIVLESIKELREEENVITNSKLVIIKASNDEASQRYINNKIKHASLANIDVEIKEFDENVTQERISLYINKLNSDNNVNGILLQLPIYKHLNEKELIDEIHFAKDVDGLGMLSVNASLYNSDIYIPCTPLGVMMLLSSYDINPNQIEGMNVVIVGRGTTSGRPMAQAFLNLNANVTTLHSKTKEKDMKRYIQNADIVISCVGKRYLLKAHWFKEDSIVIGVGFNYDETGKQHLDFEVDKVIEQGYAKLVTDRVNCTGIATIYGLIRNVVVSHINYLTIKNYYQ